MVCSSASSSFADAGESMPSADGVCPQSDVTGAAAAAKHAPSGALLSTTVGDAGGAAGTCGSATVAATASVGLGTVGAAGGASTAAV